RLIVRNVTRHDAGRTSSRNARPASWRVTLRTISLSGWSWSLGSDTASLRNICPKLRYHSPLPEVVTNRGYLNPTNFEVELSRLLKNSFWSAAASAARRRFGFAG